MAVDQVSKHGHASDADGGSTISPKEVSTEIIDNDGDPVTLDDDVDLSDNALTNSARDYLDLTGNDIRVGTGQSIEDVSGARRIWIRSSQTVLAAAGSGSKIHVQDVGISERDGVEVRLGDSGENLSVYDDIGGRQVLRVASSESSRNTLRLPGADLDAKTNFVGVDGRNGGFFSVLTNNDDWGMSADTLDESILSNTATTITSGGDVGQGVALMGQSEKYLNLAVREDGEVAIPRGSLHLPTGSIKDSNQDPRVQIRDPYTALYNDEQQLTIALQNTTKLRAFNGTPIRIEDVEFGGEAFRYSTSSSPPGTLELNRAHLYADGSRVVDGRSNAVITLAPSAAGSSKYIVFQQGNGDSPYIRASSGEIEAFDANGNSTTLT